MKKIVTVIAVLGLVVASQADILVTFTSGFGISDRGDLSGNTPLLAAGEQALVQLIYVGANGVVDGIATPGGGWENWVDDVIVGEFLSPVAVAGDFVTEFGVWGSTIESLVGVDGGTVYGRIFQDAVAGAGTYYYEGHLAVAPDQDSTAIPQPTPGLIYDLGEGQLAFADQQVAIPEPATFGLMGVAALGLFLARKKTRS